MRVCGPCQLCCKLVPVRELSKSAMTRCAHQKINKGCSIYSKRPLSCRAWNCLWLANEEETGSLPRPCLVYYVIDAAPDFITVIDNEGDKKRIPVLQIWVDPAHRNAHRHKSLRDFLRKKGEEGYAALIRYSETEAFTLFPPAMTADGQFHEVESQCSRKETTPEEIAELFDLSLATKGDGYNLTFQRKINTRATSSTKQA